MAVCGILAPTQAYPQDSERKKEIIEAVRRTNDYFMSKYNDPTLDTYVKKRRTSNLWTRAVYYEGLMALYEVDRQQRYLDYTDRWADYHGWMARGGVEATDADNQCCQQTYIDRHIQSQLRKDLSKVKENLDYQISTRRHDYWTWIDAIQMAMPVYAKYAQLTGQPEYLDYAIKSYIWTRDFSIRGRGYGGETRTMCHPTRRKTGTTVIGAVGMDGSMQPSCASWRRSTGKTALTRH